MGRYIVRRLLQAIPLMLVISFLLFYAVFSLGDPVARITANNPRATPEDIARLKHLYGLDRPRPLQYVFWLRNAATGNWGDSLVTREPVMTVIRDRLGNTLILMTTAFILTLLIAIPIGLISALKQYSLFDHVVTGLSFLFYSFPVFFLAFMLIYIFAVKFEQWHLPALPAGQMYDIRAVTHSWTDVAKHVILPAFTLALLSAAVYVRYLRASVLEVLGQDYIRTARSKGLPEAALVRRHVMKNAALPLVTIILLNIASLFSGAIVTETIFSWPGMGQLFIQSADAVDYPVLMGILVISAALIVLFNLIADIVYAYLDPRISYS